LQFLFDLRSKSFKCINLLLIHLSFKAFALKLIKVQP
jgi:hypothetical protein